jgi:hypothetical protein
MAGDLARGGASHAIADDEGALLRARTTGVLIGAADAATMGEHGEEAVGRVLWRRGVAVRVSGCGDSRLGAL